MFDRLFKCFVKQSRFLYQVLFILLLFFFIILYNCFCHQTGELITGWAYKREACDPGFYGINLAQNEYPSFEQLHPVIEYRKAYYESHLFFLFLFCFALFCFVLFF